MLIVFVLTTFGELLDAFVVFFVFVYFEHLVQIFEDVLFSIDLHRGGHILPLSHASVNDFLVGVRDDWAATKHIGLQEIGWRSV